MNSARCPRRHQAAHPDATAAEPAIAAKEALKREEAFERPADASCDLIFPHCPVGTASTASIQALRSRPDGFAKEFFRFVRLGTARLRTPTRRPGLLITEIPLLRKTPHACAGTTRLILE
jgi:hypothetical protein